MAGAVLRAKGSSSKSPKQWASFIASASKKRWSSAANKTICGENRFKRSRVRLNKLCPSIKGTNCLGKLCRLKGQSLVPEPPHKITGVMVAWALPLRLGWCGRRVSMVIFKITYVIYCYYKRRLLGFSSRQEGSRGKKPVFDFALLSFGVQVQRRSSDLRGRNRLNHISWVNEEFVLGSVRSRR